MKFKILGLLTAIAIFICIKVVFNFNDIAFAKGPDTHKIANVGISTYAIMSKNFGSPSRKGSDCAELIKALEGIEVINLSFLWGAFGNNLECLEYFFADPRLKSFEIHAMNECCHRQGNCDPSYDFLAGISLWDYRTLLASKNPTFLRKLKNYFGKINKYLEEKAISKGIACYVSPGLESNINDHRASSVLLKITKRAFPKCKMVWNPVASNSNRNPAPARILELHGPTPNIYPPCISNLDGQDISFAQRKSYWSYTVNENYVVDTYLPNYASCKIAFLWTWESNCLTNDPPSGFQWRPGRTCNNNGAFKLTADLIRRYYTKYGAYGFYKWTTSENAYKNVCKKLLPKKDYSYIVDKDMATLTVSETTPFPLIVKFQNSGYDLHTFYKDLSTNTWSLSKNSLLMIPENSLTDVLPYHSIIVINNGESCIKLNNPKISKP